MPAPFEFPAWASVLYGRKAPERPDLPTSDAPELEPLTTEPPKGKVGRPPGKYGPYDWKKRAVKAKKETA